MKRSKDADGVYLRKDRPGYWITWFDAQGRRLRRKTDARTLTQAKQARAAELLRAEQSRTLGFSPPGAESFTEIGKRYLAHQRVRLTTRAYERERGIVEQHLAPFFATALKAVRRVDVQRYLTKRCGEVSAETARKELNVLKHLLKLAMEWEIIPANPAQGVKGPKAPAGRVRYLQSSELSVVLSAAPEWLRPIILVAVFTGMRRSEILSLRWLDVDLLHGRVLLPQTKNGDGRIVYLNRSAAGVLESMARSQFPAASDLVFGRIPGERVSVAFARACRRVKITDFRFHDLRHTAASWLRMRGADVHTVAQVLGHKDLRMAIRYQHLSPAYLAEAVARLDGAFEDTCHQAVTGDVPVLTGRIANA
jgi:integrase